MVINWILRVFWTTDLGMNFLILGFKEELQALQTLLSTATRQ